VRLTGQMVFEACMLQRLLNDIRGWDRREYTEEYGGGTWQCVLPGLNPAEKVKWEMVAAELSAGGRDE